MVAHPRLRVGIDVCDVRRMTRLISDHPDAARRLFTEAELAAFGHSRQAGRHLAARFAAKEAVLKAFGSGIADGLRWRDIEVVRGPSGRPQVELHGGAAAWASRHGLVALDVSLSHDAGVALAQVVTVWDAAAPV